MISNAIEGIITIIQLDNLKAQHVQLNCHLSLCTQQIPKLYKIIHSTQICQFLQKINSIRKNLATLQVIYREYHRDSSDTHLFLLHLLSKIICILTRNNFVSSEVRDLLFLQNISIVLWHGQSQKLNPFLLSTSHTIPILSSRLFSNQFKLQFFFIENGLKGKDTQTAYQPIFVFLADFLQGMHQVHFVIISSHRKVTLDYTSVIPLAAPRNLLRWGMMGEAVGNLLKILVFLFTESLAD